MNETFNRQQVDAITAPWLNLCKEQEERIEELKEEVERCRQRAKVFEESNIYLLVENAELKAALETLRNECTSELGSPEDYIKALKKADAALLGGK